MKDLLKYYFSLFVMITIILLFITYGLFQFHLLPKFIAKYVAKILFYPTIPITYLLNKKTYWSQVDDTIILGCAPISLFNHIHLLYTKEKVRAVINLCDEYKGSISTYKVLNIQLLHLPTVDHTEPSVDNILKAVRFIEEIKNRNERVYVHCKAGHGRSAAIAFSWLLFIHPEKTPFEIQEKMNKIRKVRKELYLQPNIQIYYKGLLGQRKKSME